jgi:Mg2+/Co2+ transporter CorB
LIERLENIPAAGTQLRIGSLQIEVLQVADNTVRTVRVRMPRATGAAGSAEPVERHAEGRGEP